MNTFDSSANSPTGPRNAEEARNIKSSSSRSPTHADSGLSSSASSSRSHSSFSSRKYSGQKHTKSSTESTPINTAGASARNYQATAPANTQGDPSNTRNHDQNIPGSNIGSNGSNRVESTRSDSPTEPHQSWYSRFIDRFGALELENKGSVARDHLALGMAPVSYPNIQSHDVFPNHTHRTNIPCLDAHLSRFRLNRYRRNPTLSTKHSHRRHWFTRRSWLFRNPLTVYVRYCLNYLIPRFRTFTQCWETSRNYLHRRGYFDSSCGLSPLLRKPILDCSRQIPGKSGKCCFDSGYSHGVDCCGIRGYIGSLAGGY